MAGKYLTGKADIWFDGFVASQPEADWSLFSEELCRMFSETTGKDVVETFSKIKQLGTDEDKGFESGSEEIMEISINSLVGRWKHQTRVPGVIKGRKVSNWIDNRNTHSFFDEKLTSEL